jgi:hypothetical protein
MRRLLRLWFSVADPVDRKTYAVHGFGLMAFKYALDAALIWRFTGRFWTPLDYINPLWSARQEVLQGAPAWLAPALVVLTLPFLWIGVSMTLRRAVHDGGRDRRSAGGGVAARRDLPRPSAPDGATVPGGRRRADAGAHRGNRCGRDPLL